MAFRHGESRTVSGCPSKDSLYCLLEKSVGSARIRENRIEISHSSAKKRCVRREFTHSAGTERFLSLEHSLILRFL